MAQIAGELWINESDSYSNFALLPMVGWALALGVCAAALAVAIGAAQSLVRAVV